MKNLVLVKFLQDEMVDPRDSEVSGWKERGGGVALLPRILQNFDTIYMFLHIHGTQIHSIFQFCHFEWMGGGALCSQESSKILIFILFRVYTFYMSLLHVHGSHTFSNLFLSLSVVWILQTWTIQGALHSVWIPTVPRGNSVQWIWQQVTMCIY